MQENTFTFKISQSPQTELFARFWRPDGLVRGVIVIAHGMGEHSGRYAGLAEFFAAKGFATLANDHHGHGKTTGKKGHVRSFGLFHDELDAMTEEARRRCPDVPLVLWGHSLGGSIALTYVIQRRPTAFRAVVATSSAIKLAFEPAKLLVAIGKLTRKIAPGFTQHNQLNAADLSHDPEVVRDYKEDPLVHAYVSSELGLSTLENGEALYSFTGDFGLPLLLMHGTEDRITSFRGSEMFARQAKGDISYKPWEGLFHETHNEPQREEVLQFAADWLEGYFNGA
jgi:alpha-beta hydrolase superfamily lysophospholipase